MHISTAGTSRGVIDPVRESWFVTTKTYADQTSRTVQGLGKRRYWVHALDTRTLAANEGFSPVALEGLQADNAPWRVFEGGKRHQRPALLQVGDHVHAGFASHYVQYNFSGWVVAWHAGTGEIAARFATQGGHEVCPSPLGLPVS